MTPEREYLLVAEFFAGTVELGEAEVTDQVIADDGLRIIRKLWDAGLAHRDVKLANLLVRDGRMLLIDVAFAEASPLILAPGGRPGQHDAVLGASLQPERVYRRALHYFTVEEIAEGLRPPAGLACRLSCATCCAPRAGTCTASLPRLLPAPPRPIRVQRWSARRGWGCGRRSWLWWSWSPWNTRFFSTEETVKTRWGSTTSAAAIWSRCG